MRGLQSAFRTMTYQPSALCMSERRTVSALSYWQWSSTTKLGCPAGRSELQPGAGQNHCVWNQHDGILKRLKTVTVESKVGPTLRSASKVPLRDNRYDNTAYSATGDGQSMVI
jgi:hypothetical protein